jgi:hypothetical protein
METHPKSYLYSDCDIMSDPSMLLSAMAACSGRWNFGFSFRYSPPNLAAWAPKTSSQFRQPSSGSTVGGVRYTQARPPPGALTGLSVAWFARPTGAVPQGVPLVLKKLDLDSCSGLTALPAELGALTGLQKPNLSYCKGLTAGWRSSGRSRACRSWICPTAKG